MECKGISVEMTVQNGGKCCITSAISVLFIRGYGDKATIGLFSEFLSLFLRNTSTGFFTCSHPLIFKSANTQVFIVEPFEAQSSF